MSSLTSSSLLPAALLSLALVQASSAQGIVQRLVGAISGNPQLAAQINKERGPIPPYPGVQYELGTIGKTKITFRPELFKLEAISLVVSIAYVLIYLLGRASNKSLARRWIKAASPTLINEFSHIGASAAAGAGADRLIWNGSDEALLYASGRRGVRQMEVLFDYFPRHDLIQTIFWPLFDLIAGSAVPSKRDLITVRFVLPSKAGKDGQNPPISVFALVNKSDLRSTRSGRYDLSFTQLRLNAVEQRGLDENWVLMNEAADMTDQVLGPVVGNNKPRQDGILPGLQALLALPELRDSLASFTVTDMPFNKPEDGPIEEPVHHVILSLKPGRSLEKALPAIFALGLNLVDAIDQGLWAPSANTLAKLRKTRAETNATLLKEARADKIAAEEEAREEARKKAAKEKFDKLSPAEQDKKKELEKKRAQRKAGAKRS
ncbi:hypothetical protein OC846_000933 [Tilletia horrida]|uniref:DUF1682-domain-containing protein n=1 Tax=Tilletia horrida TaxID=155126 RepID=A0AAN6K0F0_9BASI|nr:hypothetical protein OC845_000843 [Tilletia horrida]KAK0556745.1 hypothetical protein OC846_000933 [Tilletia horrida]